MDEPATAWALLKFGLPGGVGLLLFFAVMAAVIATLSTAASEVKPPASQLSPATIEVSAGGKDL